MRSKCALSGSLSLDPAATTGFLNGVYYPNPNGAAGEADSKPVVVTVHPAQVISSLAAPQATVRRGASRTAEATR